MAMTPDLMGRRITPREPFPSSGWVVWFSPCHSLFTATFLLVADTCQDTVHLCQHLPLENDFVAHDCH